ncbi:MAG: hypothetical protein ACXAB7_06850 [Candidatus Kariarchaeaceae archaeon]|jgi:hypothetical protein
MKQRKNPIHWQYSGLNLGYIQWLIDKVTKLDMPETEMLNDLRTIMIDLVLQIDDMQQDNQLSKPTLVDLLFQREEYDSIPMIQSSRICYLDSDFLDKEYLVRYSRIKGIPPSPAMEGD